MSAAGPQAGTAVVVVNFGSHELIDRNVAAMGLTPADHVVVVVDSFFTSAERRDLERLAALQGWECLALPDNRGFGAAANAGAARAAELGCRCLVFLNPDACASPAVIDALAGAVTEDPMSVVTPQLRSPLRDTVDRGAVVDLRTGRIRRTGTVLAHHARPWIPATCMAVSLAMFEQVNGFDESYFMYWEDVDFSVRAAAAGAQLVVDDSLEVVHDSGGTQRSAGGRAKSSLYYRYNCRNRLRFAARHLSAREIVRWMYFTPQESWAILLQGGRRQFLHSLAPLGAAIGGSLAGLAAAATALFGRRPQSSTFARETL